MNLPTPHGDKLNALLLNNKLPQSDRPKIKRAIKRYLAWIKSLEALPSGDVSVAQAVALLNEYRLFLDLDVIFDSRNDFLYRQKGQIKLDNTVIEEFLPHLLYRMFPEITEVFSIGPQPCFAALYFISTVRPVTGSPGAQVRRKDQDFTISRKMYLRASFHPDHSEGVDQMETNLGYLCAECKTNLDKTMFQEACATAHDLKTAAPGSKYLLLCEWLDMTPISTSGTDIDEVLILRKAKRLGSQVRSAFSTTQGRKYHRDDYATYLSDHPFAPPVFERLLSHVRALLQDSDPHEGDTLGRGYF